MRELIPEPYLAYVAAAIEGITLSGRELFTEAVAEGTLLVLDHSAYPVVYAFPERWEPPRATSDRVAWLCCFFWGVTLNGHEVEVEEDGEWLYLKETFSNKQIYPWIVRFRDGWQVPPPPDGVSGGQLPLPAGCEREQLVGQLSALYGMTREYLADLSREQLIPLIDLAPDIPGVCIQQRWIERRPRGCWQKFRWSLFGTPMGWRFEVQVMADPPWQYAVQDSLEEARRAAWEANRQFGPRLDRCIVTRENVEEVTDRIHRFLAGWYFTTVEKSPLYPLARAWRHRRLRQWEEERSPVYCEVYQESRRERRYGLDTGSILVFDVSVPYEFPMIPGEDATFFPGTSVTFEATRLTLRVSHRRNDGSACYRTTVFVREAANTLAVGESDEWGTYHGE